jgi:hypothetical protein
MTILTQATAVCDRCKEGVDLGVYRQAAGWGVIEVRHYPKADRVEDVAKGDLCSRCVAEFRQWWKR